MTRKPEARQAHAASKGKSKVEFMEPLPPRRNPAYSSSPGSAKYRSRARSGTPASSPMATRRFPFNVPPSCMTKEAFRWANPFVNVLKSSSVNLQEDPFADSRHMNRKALLAAINGITVSAPVAAMVTKNPSSEVGGRGFHLSLASDFWRITRPAPKLPLISIDDDAPPSCDIGLTGDGDYDLDVDIQMVPSSSSTSSSPYSLDIKQEGNPRSEKRELKFDIQFQVFDMTLEGWDKKAVTLLVDCKWDSVSLNKIWQVATYGIHSALKNMTKGRTKPIYLQLWSFTLWSYAILYPRAMVEVKEGKVVSTTNSSCSVAAMDRVLQKATNELRKHLNDSTLEYEDGLYLAGALYINVKHFQLPRFDCEGDAQHSDCLKFFEGNIRILVGERVLGWKEKDVLKAIDVRNNQIRSMKLKFMNHA